MRVPDALAFPFSSLSMSDYVHYMELHSYFLIFIHIIHYQPVLMFLSIETINSPFSDHVNIMQIITLDWWFWIFCIREELVATAMGPPAPGGKGLTYT